MDLAKLLNNVRNLTDYIAITQELTSKYSSQNVELSMSAIMCFKRIRSLEIEYFNKCHESGAAFRLFERVLRQPPSKEWGLLGKGLVDLIVYWTDAVRHHLIDHHIHWWLFLKQLLKFTQVIITKEEGMVNIVTEELAESYLELATNERTGPEQCHEIVSTLNVCCTDSGREVRSRLKERLEKSFIKLAHVIATCGHYPAQYSALECLLRFLVARQDRLVRATAAKAWFPLRLYRQEAIVTFLKRPWKNFLQDARDFLNAQNCDGRLVCSVICQQLTVGTTTFISDQAGQWLDFNMGSKSVTAFLLCLDLHKRTVDWLTITCDNVTRATLCRDTEVTISISTVEGPKLCPSQSPLQGTEVTIRVGLTDLDRVHEALQRVFGAKFHNIIESSLLSKQAKRIAKSGQAEMSRPFKSSNSTASTASTTSLALLPEKLKALPPLNLDARPRRQTVIATPDLSRVTELSEADEIQDSFSSRSTLIIRPCQIGLVKWPKGPKAFSDDNMNTTADPAQLDNSRGSQSDNDSRKKFKNVPKRFKDTEISGLLAVALESADQKLLDKSLEGVAIDDEITTDNLTELLLKEALGAREEKDKIEDSGINTAEKRSQDASEYSAVIENTPLQDLQSIMNKSKKIPTVVRHQPIPPRANENSKVSTSDESNTSVINETPMTYVNVRKRNLSRRKSEEQLSTATAIADHAIADDGNVNDGQGAVAEDFFTQNIGHQPAHVSPTRAREINETSSDSSYGFGACLVSNKDCNVNVEQFNHDVEVMECIANMIDKVCSDLEKCSENLIQDIAKAASVKAAENIVPLKDITNVEKQNTKRKGTKRKPAPKKQVLKIKIKGPHDSTKTAKTKQNKLQLELAKQSPASASRVDILADKNKSPESKELSPPLVRRKRKLYSPKDYKNTADDIENDDENLCQPAIMAKRKSNLELNDDTDDDLPLKEIKTKYTPKSRKYQSKASCYIDIEKDKGDQELDEDKEDDLPLKEIKTKYTPKSRKYQTKASCYIDIEKDKGDQEHDEDKEDDLPLKEIKTKYTPKSRKYQTKASCYIDIEKDKKKFKARGRRTQSRCRLSPLSPKSQRRNDIFDSLKTNIESAEKITLIDKKSDKDLAIYNFTSDSDDEDFKKKKAEVQKRASITPAVSEKSLASTRKSKVTKKKIPVSSSESSIAPVKPVKRKAQRGRGRNPKIDRVLEDERMREATNEVLNTSLVADKPQADTNKDLEPKIVAPEPEMIVEEHEPKSEVACKTEGKKPAKKKDVLKSDKVERAKTPKPEVKRSKIPKLDIVREEDERTSSPLPALEVETVNPKNKDGDDSTVTNILVQKITKMYQNQDAADDANTTQNLLSENDRMESPSDLGAAFNITDDVERDLDKDKNDTVLAGSSVTGRQVKSKRYSDISDAENENILSEKRASKSKECVSGAKKKILSLKKNTIIERCENITESRGNKSKIVIVEEKKEEILKPANVSAVHKSSKPKSSVSEDIISINDDTDIASIVKLRRNKKSITVIEEIDLTSEDDESDKSIATDGITGHGDSEEPPPMSEALKEKFVSRELEDMEPALKKYSEMLDKVLHGFNDKTQTKATAEVKYMQDVIEKISSEIDPEDNSKHSDVSSDRAKNWENDVRRYLPSPRESFSSTKSEFSNIKIQTRKGVQIQNMSIKDKSAEEICTSGKGVTKTNITEVNTKRKSQISPLVFLEDMPKSKVKPKISAQNTSKDSTQQRNTTPKSRTLPLPKSPDSTEITKKIVKNFERSEKISVRSIRTDSTSECSDGKIVAEPFKSGVASITKKILQKHEKPTKLDDTSAKPINITESPKIPNTFISPEKKIPYVVIRPLTAEQTPKHHVISPIISSNRNMPEMSPRSKNIIKQLLQKSPGSRLSKISTSTPKKQVYPEGSLKRSSVNDMGVSEVSPKRPKVVPRTTLPKFTLESSGPSIASVNEWLKETELSGKVISDEDARKEIYSNIMEKLNTTMAELHQNSGRNFRRLFVDAHRRLMSMQEERQKQQKELKEMVNQLEEKSAARDLEFMCWLQRSAAELLRDEMTQRRAVVRLLREDAQAVLDHLARSSQG